MAAAARPGSEPSAHGLEGVRRDVVVVCAQERDRRAIRAAGLDARYRVHYVGEDLDAEGDADVGAILNDLDRVPADGIVGTKDRSALLAAIASERRRLPGPTPAALLACQHKPTSRALQLGAVPEVVPPFAVLDRRRRPGFPPPYFIKPVVGRLSQLARRIDDAGELPRRDGVDGYRRGYAEIARHAGLPADSVRGWLVEELRTGAEVTLEGYVFRGRVTTIGITDSRTYPRTNSFERFEYPSRLPSARRTGLAAIAERLLPALGFDGGFFNVEFLVPRRGPPTLIEVNGRIASQFAPLVAAVHGRSTYDVLFALACGEDPQWEASPPVGVAVSYVVRAFRNALVTSAPEPSADVEVLVKPGQMLAEQGPNDVASYRLAIVYAYGADRKEALASARARARALPFVLDPPARARQRRPGADRTVPATAPGRARRGGAAPAG